MTHPPSAPPDGPSATTEETAGGPRPATAPATAGALSPSTTSTPVGTVPPPPAGEAASTPTRPGAQPESALPGPPRRTAWAEGVDRLRNAAGTEPGRLRIIGAALAGLLLLTGAITAWEIDDRATTAGAVIDGTQPLSADAADLYRSLAHANTTAAAGFLAEREEPREVRERYEENIRSASALLSAAASHSDGSADAQRQITLLSEELPVYTGLVEAARANERQGLPLGGAYLRYADAHMQHTLLPAAEELYELERERFQSELDKAQGRPWAALGAGAVTLGTLLWAQRRHYRRTHRVFNPGLVAATTAAALVLGWSAGAQQLSATALAEADQDAARSLHVLNDVWTSALQARGDENMTLVMRGAGAAFAESYQERMVEMAGEEAGPEPDGLLADAVALADDPVGREPVVEAAGHTAEWRSRHGEAMDAQNAGDYDTAVALITGEESTAASFDEVDRLLAHAVEHEQGQFDAAAGRGLARLDGLPVGAGILALAGAVGAVLGIGRRLSEYR